MSTSCVDCNVQESLPLLRARDTSPQHEFKLQPTGYFRWKGLIDRTLAAGLLLPGLPLIGLLVALIRLTSKGPGVYQQVRVGLNGKPYTMFKLRSMRIDAEHGTGAVWAKQSDSRITPLGYWLRKLHLDELPQLFNVLRGEMSLIGPRPERPEFVKLLTEEIPGYAHRLHVRPGVTGLAQINLPADSDLNDVRRKIVLDREYIETGSLILDLRILCCTLLRMLGLRGERAMRLMRLDREVQIEPGNPHFSVTQTSQEKPAVAAPFTQRKDNELDLIGTSIVADTISVDAEPVSVGLES